MAAFEAVARAKFVALAVDHAARFDPGGFGALDSAAKHRVADETLAIAARHGVVSEAGTILFLEARCASGPAFPDGADFVWAQTLLSADRIDERRTMEYLRDVALDKAGWRGG